MDWILVKGLRVLRISDVPEPVHPAHEPADDEARREAREARRKRDFSLRRELEELELLAEPLTPETVEAELFTPSEASAPAPAPAQVPATPRNPAAEAQARALVEAARDGTPLCEV